MPRILIWILLAILHNKSPCNGAVHVAAPSQIFLSSGDSSFEVTVTNEDCSADIVLQSQESYAVYLKVVLPDGSIYDHSVVEANGFVVVRISADEFTDDSQVKFVTSNSEGAVATFYFSVIYNEILSGLSLTADPWHLYAPIDSIITLLATVDYGELVTFKWDISGSKTTDLPSWRRDKSSSHSYTLASTPQLIYIIGVTATSSTPATMSMSMQIKIEALLPLPPFEIMLAPVHLMTNNESMLIATGETVKFMLQFLEDFDEADTEVVSCSLSTYSFDLDFDAVPPAALLPVEITYWHVGNITETAICYTYITEQHQNVTLDIRSLTDYSRAAIVDPVIPFNDDKGFAEAEICVWNEYIGYSNHTILLSFELGDSLQTEDNYELQTKDYVCYKLTYTDRDDYEIIVSFLNDEATNVDVSLKLMTTKIDLRVGVIQVSFDGGFNLAVKENERMFFFVFKLANESLTLLVTYAPSDHESVGMDYLSESAELSKVYTNHGTYKIIVETTFIGEVEKYITQEFTILANPGAVLLSELFEIKYRDIEFPLPARLSNVPTIAARSPVEANLTYTLQFDWGLQKNETDTTWSEIVIIQPNAINLVLQNFISTPGLYKIMLTIHIAELNESAYDYMYMDVEDEPVVAVIKGGSIQTVPFGEAIRLDGSLSYDPGSLSSDFNDVDLSYQWACYELPTTDRVNVYTTSFIDDTSYRLFPTCNSSSGYSSSDSVLTVPSESLGVNSWTLFELVVRERGGFKEGWISQAVHVVENIQPTIKVICFWNCGAKLVTSERTVIHVEIICPTCAQTDILNALYKWSVYEINVQTGLQTLIPVSEWPEEIDSEETSTVFDSRGGWWKEAHAYKVTVDVDIAPRPVGKGEINLFTNLPPYGGSCGVAPLQGIAGLTEFRFIAVDWRDEGSRSHRDPDLDLNPILTYTFYQEATISTPYIYSGGEISTPNKKLVACGTPSGVCDVIVHVMDAYDGVTECSMKVEVTEQVNLTSMAQTEQVTEATGVIERLELQMDDTLKKKDPVKIAQDAATYASILKSMSDPIQVEEQFTDITFQTLDSDEGISGLLDVNTAREPLKDTLAKAGNELILDTNKALNDAVRRNDVRDAKRVEIFTKSFTSSMQSGEKYTTGPTIGVATGSLKNLSHILSQELKPTRVVRDVNSALESMGDFMDTMVDTMAIDASSLEPTPNQLGKDTGLTDREIEYTAELLARRRKFKTQSRLEEAPKIVTDARQIWDNMFQVTKSLKDHRGSYRMDKENVKMALQKTSRRQIAEAVQVLGGIEDVLSFTLDEIDNDDEDEDVYFQVVKTKNIFSYGEHSKYISTDVIIASVETENHRKLPMMAPTVRHAVHKSCQTNESLEMIQPQFIEGDAAQMFYHQFEYSNPHAKVCLSIRPSSDAVIYRLYAKVGSEPNDLNYDYRVTIAKSLMVPCKELCIPTGKLRGKGTAYIGLRPMKYSIGGTGRRKRSATAVTDPLASPYMYGMTVTACYSWDDQVVDWIASKCQMQRNGSDITCRCETSSELNNGLYFQHVPNRIHFGTVFSKFDVENQAAVLGTLIGVYLLFTLLAMWAHYMDRRSILKWGVFPLQDNYADDEYFYLITVYTGLRKGAGTTSNIGFSLCGDMEETGIRALTDGIREGMPTGSVVHLVMSVPSDLGPLHYLRIWHDNSGTGAGGSWYLDKVVVLDLQNGDSYQFFNQRWMCSEENSLDILVMVSSPEEVKAFERNFFSTASKQVTDDHMWLSVLIRPERSRFNRLERVGCCLAFLLLSMIASAMFYQGAKGNDRVQPQPDLRVGALRMSWQQVYYSLVAAVITSVPVFAIIMIFRRARFRVEEKLTPRTFACKRKSSKIQDIIKLNDGRRKNMRTSTKSVSSLHADHIVEKDMGASKITFSTSQSDLGKSVSSPTSKIENDLSSSRCNLENGQDIESHRSDIDRENEGQIEAEKTTGTAFHQSPTKQLEEDMDEGFGEYERKTENKHVDFEIEPTVVSDAKDIENDCTGKTDLDDDSAYASFNTCCGKAPWMRKLEKEIRRLNKMLLIRPAGRQNLKGSWPYATRLLAWVLIFTIVIVCTFFIVLYSMEWGKDVTEEWLSTFFLSFLQSLVIVDPTKVLLITFLFTIFIGSSDFVGVREINMKIVSEVNKECGIKEKTNPPRKDITSNTFNPEELQEATLKRKVRVLVRHTLMELGIHGLLLMLVGSLCFTTRTTMDYRMQETVHNSLIGSKYSGFQYINSTKMYFDWLENVVTPWLFPNTNYKGEFIMSEDRLYTADWSLYRLGAPRLRQVRMPMRDCMTKKIRSIPCVDIYSIGDEVKTEYCFGWQLPLPCPAIDQVRVTAGSWYFRPVTDLWDEPFSGHQSSYGGGGYMTNLDINAIVAKGIIKETKNSFWIDRQTRAVFFEFTLYSPNTDKFITVVLLAEFLPSGGVVTFYAVHPFSPYPPRGALGHYIKLVEIVAILFTAVGFVYIIHEFKVHKKAALCNFWFMIDVLVFVCATTAISMYSMRFSALKFALGKMRDDPTKYVNFKNVIIWDTGYTSCLGFLIALTSFRLLKLAGYSKRTMRVYEVLRLSLGVLPSFMASMWIMLSSFAITGYVLFQATSPFYKNYFDSVLTLFLGVLGKTGFKNTGLPPAGFHITFFYIILFGCIVNIFLANWFIAVLLEILTVSAQRDCPAVRSDNAKVFQLLWESFVFVFSKKHPPFETLRYHRKTEHDENNMDKVTEEFEEWVARLNLKQKPRHKNEGISSVAVYNKASKNPKNARQVRKRITRLSYFVNNATHRNDDNKKSEKNDVSTENEREKPRKKEKFTGLGERADTLTDSLFDPNTKIGVWHN